MAALYSDENYPLGIVKHLRKLGHDVLTCREAGNADRGVTDEEVLAFATAQRRAVITHNRKDFFRLHVSSAGQHGGIVACTFDSDEARQAARVHAAVSAHPDGLQGKVLRVYRPA
jgi:predicted nuclease of predicted toxin-antitoxin system